MGIAGQASQYARDAGSNGHSPPQDHVTRLRLVPQPDQQTLATPDALRPFGPALPGCPSDLGVVRLKGAGHSSRCHGKTSRRWSGPAMLILSSFCQIYHFGIAVPTGQDVGFDPYVSDPLPCVVLPGATFRPLSRPVQHPVRLSGTPYGGQSPRRFPGVMLPRARFAVSQGLRPAVLPVSGQRFVAGHPPL